MGGGKWLVCLRTLWIRWTLGEVRRRDDCCLELNEQCVDGTAHEVPRFRRGIGRLERNSGERVEGLWS